LDRPAGAAFILALYIAVTEIPGRGAVPQSAERDEPAAPGHAGPSRFRSGAVRTIAPLMALFATFVIAIPYAGFDIATFAFVAATLWLLGERRRLVTLVLALYHAGVAAPD
jgi:hypothetical protein